MEAERGELAGPVSERASGPVNEPGDGEGGPAEAGAGHDGPDAEPPKACGLLLIDKPVRRTSMDVCRRVRGKLVASGEPKRIKVGHGGTLDPLASGLMVVMVGRATRLVERVMAGEKRYVATIDLSHRSPTDDLESEPEPVAVAVVPERSDVERALAERFTGVVMQRPPAHSAISVGGERAYRIAREGGDPGLVERPVVIHQAVVMSYAWPVAQVSIVCGKGTYIRSLARDLGVVLGTGGMLTGLRRTGSGRWRVEDAVGLDALPRVLTRADLMEVPAWLAEG